jgi:hypothetical protein
MTDFFERRKRELGITAESPDVDSSFFEQRKLHFGLREPTEAERQVFNEINMAPIKLMSGIDQRAKQDAAMNQTFRHLNSKEIEIITHKRLTIIRQKWMLCRSTAK